MKRKSIRRQTILRAAAASAGVFLPIAIAEATTYFWDTNGSATSLGSATTPVDWFTNSWGTDPNGTSAVGAWANTNPSSDTAWFGGKSGVVNVNSPVFVNSIGLGTANYSINSSTNYITFNGTTPRIVTDVNSGSASIIAAPIAGTVGLTITGNLGSNRFVTFANASAVNPNTFTGGLQIVPNGNLRLGGGAANEQIPDSNDMSVSGVIDFITSGGASDGKQEKVRNVTVSGSSANFSVGNGSNFVVNSITGTSTATGPGIALNGNSATNPARLTINGWDGGGDLNLNDGSVRLNTTSAGGSTGGSVVRLTGNLVSTGNSFVHNVNGGAAGGGNPATNVFPFQDFDFTSTVHTVDVSSGVLTFTSASITRPLAVTFSGPSAPTISKTGAGEWIYANAVQGPFGVTNRVLQGTWTIAADERLANASTLLVSGGSFNMQGFSETVANVILGSGTIAGTGAGALVSTNAFDLRQGLVTARLGGASGLNKTTAANVTLSGLNDYTGPTHVSNGALFVTGTLGKGHLTIDANATVTLIGAPKASVVSGISIAASAVLDLTDNGLAIDYTGPLGTLLSDVKSYIHPSDQRIRSSLTTPGKRIGYRDTADVTGMGMQSVTFDGAPIDATSVLVLYTWDGDTNLDGAVDVEDLYNLAVHFNQGGQSWPTGDFDYDGDADIDDLNLLAINWNEGTAELELPPLGPVLASLGLPQVSVPEPSLLFVAMAVIPWSLKRPRRSSHHAS